MSVERILATVAELGERHDLLTIDERDGAPVVRCTVCGDAVVVGS